MKRLLRGLIGLARNVGLVDSGPAFCFVRIIIQQSTRIGTSTTMYESAALDDGHRGEHRRRSAYPVLCHAGIRLAEFHKNAVAPQLVGY
jgi:hypothetical protein